MRRETVKAKLIVKKPASCGKRQTVDSIGGCPEANGKDASLKIVAEKSAKSSTVPPLSNPLPSHTENLR